MLCVCVCVYTLYYVILFNSEMCSNGNGVARYTLIYCTVHWFRILSRFRISEWIYSFVCIIFMFGGAKQFVILTSFSSSSCSSGSRWYCGICGFRGTANVCLAGVCGRLYWIFCCWYCGWYWSCKHKMKQHKIPIAHVF